jgi:hypothetical protein
MNPAEIPLRDIHLPGSVAWWPPALGWWLVAGLAVAGLCALWLWRRHRTRTALRRRVLCELDAIGRRHTESGDAGALSRELSRLTRRLVLASSGDGNPASLSGEQWIAFLREYSGDCVLPGALAAVLAEGAYQPSPHLDGDEIVAAYREWISSLPSARLARA